MHASVRQAAAHIAIPLKAMVQSGDCCNTMGVVEPSPQVRKQPECMSRPRAQHVTQLGCVSAQGKIDWEAVLKPLCTHAMWHFHVPAGGSTAGHSMEIRDVALAAMAARVVNSDVSSCARIAKILMWTLRRDLSLQPKRAGGQTALGSLRAISCLLGHYYHASNSGRHGPSFSLSTQLIHICEFTPTITTV
jgi:hypothetical protein